MDSVTTNAHNGFRLAVLKYARELRESNRLRRLEEPHGGCAICDAGTPRFRKDGTGLHRVCAGCHRLNRDALNRRRAAELRMPPAYEAVAA